MHSMPFTLTVANWLLQASAISSSVTPAPFTKMPSLEVSVFGFVHASTSSCEKILVTQPAPVREPVFSTQA